MYSGINRFHSTPNRETIITVAASGGDYTTIKAAMAYATANATALNHYRIYVRNGTYNEIQIVGANYVAVEGESQSGVIMISDGLRTDVDPISGQRYVDMAQDTKYGWLVSQYMVFRNMTVRVNDVKYCFHIDAGGVYILEFENCRFEHSNGFPLGIGIRVNQKIKFSNCAFAKLGNAVNNGSNGSHGVFIHNVQNQAGPCRFEMEDCSSVNCGFIAPYELGSDYTDLFSLIRCVSGDVDRGIYYTVTNTYWNGGGQPITNIPYCINVLTVDGALALQYSVDDRPNLLAHISQE